jgi:hypothetical protein
MSELTMKPRNLTLDNALHGVGDLLKDRISPAISDPFARQMARLSCMLLTICANGVDDAAELRVEENALIRRMLGEAAALVPAPLAEKLHAAAVSTDPGLKISVLDGENHRLRVLLVKAQAALEASGDADARMLDQRIWRLLEAVEAKRTPRE